MRKFRTGMTLVLSILLSITSIGCGYGQEATQTKIVVDSTGIQVEIPVKVERVMGYATPLLADLGRDDLIVALSSEKSPNIYDYTAPTYQSIGYHPSTTHDDNNTIETIASLNPDIYFCRARSVSQMKEGLSSLGIPMVVFQHETPEEYFSALRLVAQCIGEPERAQRVIDLYTGRLDATTCLTQDAQKPTGVILGGQPGKVANGIMLQSVMMDAAGIVNVAKDIDSGGDIWPDVGVETIFSWNPDYIFVSTWGNATFTVDDILGDPAWQGLSAVQNGCVYAMPCQLDKWEYPDACSVLLAGWMASIVHPGLYADEQMEEDTLAYYCNVYGQSCDTLTREILGF